MSTTIATTRHRRPAHLSRGALVLPAVLAALGLFLIYGNLTMNVVGDGGLFGPTMMPWVVAVLSLAAAVLLAVDILRPRPEYDSPVPADPASPDGAEADGAGTDGAGSDEAPEGVNAVAVLTAVAGIVGFIVVLQFVGWILAATGLFVVVAAAMGNRRWVTVVLAGLGLAAAVQVAFSMLLGIALPSGFIGGF